MLNNCWGNRIMKYIYIVVVLGSSNLLNASSLPAIVMMSAVPSIKSCMALTVLPQKEGLKLPVQEIRKALLQEEKNLNERHIEWSHQINILKAALCAAQEQREEVVKQLCWIKAAQARMRDEKEDAQGKSLYASKDLKTLLQEEHSIINRILTVQEIADSFNEYGSYSSFWNSQRCGQAKTQYEIKLRDLYRMLEELREYKQTLLPQE